MDEIDFHNPNASGDDFKNPTDELYFHLVRAEYHARAAHDMFYEKNGPKRGLWYRMSVGRAQNILMSLWVRELNGRVINYD